MKRYLLFAGEQYYPLGGWDDLKGSFDTVEAAIAFPIYCDWKQVVDGISGDVEYPVHIKADPKWMED